MRTASRASRYLAFIVADGEPDWVRMIDLGDAAPIDSDVAALRAWVVGARDRVAASRGDLTTRDLRADIDAPEQPLASRVFEPIREALGDRRRLFVAPDGGLLLVPLEVLFTGSGRYAIEEYVISYVGTGRDLLRFRAKGAAPSEPVVIADPDFDLAASPGVTSAVDAAPRPTLQSVDLIRSDLRFGPLPGARSEGMRIGELLGARAFMGEAALESRIKALRSPRVLHIATHGFFLPDQAPVLPDNVSEALYTLDVPGEGSRILDTRRVPRDPYATADGSPRGSRWMQLENPMLRSGLALAGANTWLRGGALPAEAEDGILTAEDVTGLDLGATELVVLSACETAVGEVRAGEGVRGLRRAFTLSGARTLVTSLWKVPDRETMELMLDFYGRLDRGEPRVEALRAAQLAMKARHPDPLYWGAFILEGNPGPM